MSDAATETPEHTGAVTDSPATGHGRHRGPSAQSEEPQAKTAGPGRHRRSPDDGQDD